MTLQWMGQGRQSCRGWINLEEVRDEFVLKALLNSVSQCISLLGFRIWPRDCRSLQARAWSHGLISEIILALLLVQKSHKVPGLSLSFDVSAGGGHEENEIQFVERVHWLLCVGAVGLHFLADSVHMLGTIWPWKGSERGRGEQNIVKRIHPV